MGGKATGPSIPPGEGEALGTSRLPSAYAAPQGDPPPLQPQALAPHTGTLPQGNPTHLHRTPAFRPSSPHPTRGLCPTPAPDTFTPHGNPSPLQPQAPARPSRTLAVPLAVPRVPPAQGPALTAPIRSRPASAAPGPAPASYWPLPPRPSAGTTTPSVPRARALANSQSR